MLKLLTAGLNFVIIYFTHRTIPINNGGKQVDVLRCNIMVYSQYFDDDEWDVLGKSCGGEW